MFNEDADDSRARTEQGRKDREFRELYESVKLDIKDTADLGSDSTTYMVSESDEEFVTPLVERLEDEGFVVTATESQRGRSTLSISWAKEA